MKNSLLEPNSSATTIAIGSGKKINLLPIVQHRGLMQNKKVYFEKNRRNLKNILTSFIQS